MYRTYFFFASSKWQPLRSKKWLSIFMPDIYRQLTEFQLRIYTFLCRLAHVSDGTYVHGIYINVYYVPPSRPMKLDTVSEFVSKGGRRMIIINIFCKNFRSVWNSPGGLGEEKKVCILGFFVNIMGLLLSYYNGSCTSKLGSQLETSLAN